MKWLSRWEWVALISVLILAAVLRLGYVGVNPFGSDEARVSLLALKMARQGEIAINGISSSTGARNLPASIYAFVPPYALSTDPIIATQWVGLWSLLVVFGMWWVARKAWGSLPALIAALFMATSPFNVFFSRNIWTQNFLAPMATVWLICAYIAMTSSGRRRLWAIGGAVFLSGLAFQIHAAGIALIPATLWLIVRDGWWRKWWVVLISGAAAFLFLIPFLHEAACCHPELITEYTQTLGQGQRELNANALQFTAQIAISYGWHYLALGDNDTVARVVPVAMLAGLLLLIGIAGFVRKVMQDHDSTSRKLIELVLLLLLVPILFFSYQNAPVRLHYLLTTLPALALLAGCGVFLVQKPIWRVIVTIGAIGLSIIWAGQVLYSLSLLDNQPMPNGMSTSLEVVRDIADELPKDRPIVVLTQSDDVTSRGEPATWATLLWNTPHRIIGGWTTLILPDSPATLFTDVNGMPAWEEVQAAGLADDEQTIQVLPNTPPSYFVSYNGEPLQGYTTLESPIHFSSGLELVAWRYRVISGRLRISTVYRVTEPVPQAAVQQFTHLRTAETLEGPPPHTADISLSAQNWRVGDTVIGIADFLDFETGVDYWLDLGQYDLATGVRYSRADEGDSLRIGPFTVR
jgi:hypothetical protein